MDLNLRTLYNAIICIFLHTVLSVCDQIELCHDVYAPFLQPENIGNCSLVCTLKLQHAVSNVHDDELALCIKNSSIATFCTTHMDCRQYHVGAYCKMIPCFCKNSVGRSEYYILDSFKIPRLNTCVVSARYANPDLPIFPFPWKTLIIVFTIVLTFMLCLIGFRCASSRWRKWHAKRSRGETRQRAPEDNSSLYSSPHTSSHVQHEQTTPFITQIPRGMVRIYRASPRNQQHRNRPGYRTNYTACSQAETSLCDTLSNQDKPPPYEAAVQVLPPTYEDVERALHEEQRVEVHVPPHSSASLPRLL